MWLPRIRLLITVLWVGSLWAIGYLAAPTLFATLADKILAGAIAGSLFRTEAWVSLGCGAVLLPLVWRLPERKWLVGLVLAMQAGTLVTYFGIQPWMAELKQSAGVAGVMASESTSKFALLHGMASTIYLVQSVLGAVLVVRMR